MKFPLRFIQLGILLLFVIFKANNATAQLSGTYTINAAVVTGGTNFQSFTDAVSALTTSGVSGSVTFNVVAGTYTEQISIPAIAGASATKTITFKGLGDLTTITATPAATNLPVISLVSASHITLDSLKIQAQGTMGWGVHFMNNADTNTIKACHIISPGVKNNNCANIMASSSKTAFTNTNISAQYITVLRNTLEGGGLSLFLRGMFGSNTNDAKGFIIKDNSITGWFTYGIDMLYTSNNHISGNYVSTSASGAVSVVNVSGNNVLVEQNNLYLGSNLTGTRVLYVGMDPTHGIAGDSLNPTIIRNNFIAYGGSFSNTPVVHFKDKAHIKFYNNTVRHTNVGANATCIWFDNTNARSLRGIEIRNNILALNNSGSGQFTYSGSATIAGRFKNLVIDHNNYYAPSGYFKALIPNGTGLSTYNTFAAYKANTFGWGVGDLNVSPQFVSALDLHVTSAAMNDSGAVISGVIVDIDGETRSLTTPDIGADEYSPAMCQTPLNLNSFAVLATTASIYFVPNHATATYKLQYGPAGFALGSGTVISTANDTVFLTGLLPQTAYTIYVKAICSATDSSSWSAAHNFTTSCATISTFPYTEGFEGAGWVSGTGTNNAGNAIDACWVRNPSAVTSYNWGPRTAAPATATTGPATGFGGSGRYVYTESSTGASGNVATLRTPNIDLSSLTNPQLSFQFHMYGASMGTFMVWVWNGTAYDTLMSLSGNQGNQWNEAILNLSGYKTQVTHLLFRATRGASFTSDMAIDEIIIDEAPLCVKPTLIAASNITAHTFAVDFTSSATKFIIEYGPQGFSQGTGQFDTTTTSGHVITGLTASTAYHFYIRTDCSSLSNGYSSWAGPFTVQTRCGFVNGYATTWDYLTNNQQDSCWTLNNQGTSASAAAYDPSATEQLQPFSGTIYYRISGGSVFTNYFISPEITNLGNGTLQLRFQGAATQTSTLGLTFIVGTMPNVTDVAQFVALDTITPIVNQWTEYTVLLSNIPTNHRHVVIRNASGLITYLAIDDVNIEVQPACLPPSNLTFSNTTDTSSVLSWTAGSGSTYEIEYGTTGFIQGSGQFVNGLTTTTTTVTNLLPQTCYDFYVRGNCTNNNSAWVGPINVCTECAVKVAPFFESFDGPTWVPGSSTTNKVDVCWTRMPDGASTFRWYANSGQTSTPNTGPFTDVSGNGKYIFAETSFGSNGTLATIETPEIDFSNLTHPTLSFYYHMFGVNMGSLWVLISDGGSFDTLFTISGQQHSSSTMPWTQVYLPIDTAYKNQNRFIRFVSKHGTGFAADMAVDEVRIDELPNCLKPDSFALTTVTSNSATFSWSTLTSNTNFIIEYGPPGFIQGTGANPKVNVTGLSGSITGLLPNTAYAAYLADACDSTKWVGPIAFTTLLDDDAELVSLLSPLALSCGDSAQAVQVRVKNHGVNPITSLPLTAQISGDIQATLTTTYTGTIAPGATADVTIGTINSYAGGMVNVTAFATLANDQRTNNDTMAVAGIDLISVLPAHEPVVALCLNDTIGQFIALPQPGIANNWYYNATDTVPFYVGDTVAVQPNQTLYLDRSKDVDFFIQDANTGSNFGNMFKLYIKNDITLTGFTFEAAFGGLATPLAFYKMGNWRGYETNRSAWTLIDSTVITGAQSNQWYTRNFAAPVSFQAGDTVSLYLANRSASKIKADGLPGTGPIGSLYKATDDIEYYTGVGGAYFGSNMATNLTNPSAISSHLLYETNTVCGNNRVALTQSVNTDTAFAQFVYQIQPNGSDVNFDATGSVGHIFTWNFGDGNTGTGLTTTHTYTSAAVYTITLIVTDTLCGTSDTVSYSILTTIGVQEALLANTLNVYPNPNNGTFRVAFAINGIQPVELMVLNAIGQTLYQADAGNVSGTFEHEVSLGALPRGTYILRILVNGQATMVKLNVL